MAGVKVNICVALINIAATESIASVTGVAATFKAASSVSARAIAVTWCSAKRQNIRAWVASTCTTIAGTSVTPKLVTPKVNLPIVASVVRCQHFLKRSAVGHIRVSTKNKLPAMRI